MDRKGSNLASANLAKEMSLPRQINLAIQNEKFNLKKGQSGNMKPLPRKYIQFTFSVSNLWPRPIWQAKPIWKCKQSGAEKLNISIWKWMQSGRDLHGISIWIHGQSGNLHQSGFGPNLANIISTKRSQSGFPGNLGFYISQSKPNLV